MLFYLRVFLVFVCCLLLSCCFEWLWFGELWRLVGKIWLFNLWFCIVDVVLWFFFDLWLFVNCVSSVIINWCVVCCFNLICLLFFRMSLIGFWFDIEMFLYFGVFGNLFKLIFVMIYFYSGFRVGWKLVNLIIIVNFFLSFVCFFVLWYMVCVILLRSRMVWYWYSWLGSW